MATTQDFESFARFALPRISSGQAESIGQVLDEWEAQREEEDSLKSIQRGIDDVNAGRVTPADEVFAKIRKELGLTP